ncbi:hypothetical protein ACJMK2_015547 [Sinanodonta woodiana]|uniref:Ubiquitin-like modifier-activating enzyme ATG7 n=1 Tax=Sinanodonta woodiana TaxID=1069815 RepID=A0ABD3UU98_SINWO
MAEFQLQFAPLSSILDGGFWHKLSNNKLNVYGLDESPKTIHGFYCNGDPPGMPCRMNLEYIAFDVDFKPPLRCFDCHGTLINTNTIDKFKDCDKKELLAMVGKKIWQSITSGEALSKPDLLSQLLLLTYADLKKYHYYYWFAFPCLCPSEDFRLVRSPQKLHERLTSSQMERLITAYDEFQSHHSNHQGYFIVVETLDDVLKIDSVQNISEYLNKNTKVLFGFSDPCTLEGNPGWPLRNYLALISYYWYPSLQEVEVLCFRCRIKDGNCDISHSIVLTVKLSSMTTEADLPKCVGWEKNERQKLGPRMVNLSASMDPVKLSESAVDLNLKLMRWRLLPDLDLERITRTRCLLLGAGTLGCNVARCLLGWGVRTITFVDNGSVSYSNPVRQSLFVFEDCTKVPGGRSKAEAAAEALTKIFPGVKARGVNLSIAMPGHSVPEGSVEQTKKDVQQLEELIDSHDAMFLLLDTRESRWLPTVIGAARKKIVMCAALGFDTFLVMRHGVKKDMETDDSPVKGQMLDYRCIPGSQLGCYFCNDVVAPGDSTRDRTLDQQCTVSRPGMSYIASAQAVELLVSILQHPAGTDAPADISVGEEHLKADHCSPLGLVPHQIRGFLSRFHQLLPASRAFDKCTACSRTVIKGYLEGGFGFLLQVFNEPTYLEDLTGLTQMHQDTIDAEVWDIDEDEEFSSMDTSS